MLRWIERWKDGFLFVEMSCRKPAASRERFLNLCMANRILLWDLADRGGICRFSVSRKDFLRIRPSARKARVHLKVIGKRGLPFFVQRNRKRGGYGGGILLFFLILLAMSRFVWHISIDGNRQYSDDTMLHFLRSMDIRYGTAKASIDLAGLEEAIRSEFEDIIWVSARVSGTKLEIRVKENDGADMENTAESSDTPPAADLVADKAGTITRMIVRSGKAMVSAGDTVEPGQLLVSGALPIANDEGETDHVRYVIADADVYARTETVCYDRVEPLTVQRVMTGRIRHGLRLSVGSFTGLFLLPFGQNERWESRLERHQAVILDDFYLPVWWDLIFAREYEEYERTWTAGELEALGEERNSEKIADFKEKGVPIWENDVTIMDKGASWEIQSRFIVEEPIGVLSAIAPVPLEEAVRPASGIAARTERGHHQEGKRTKALYECN